MAEPKYRPPFYFRWWMLVIYIVCGIAVVIAAAAYNEGSSNGGNSATYDEGRGNSGTADTSSRDVVSDPVLERMAEGAPDTGLKICLGWVATIEDGIKQLLHNPDSFEWRDGGWPASSDDLVLQELDDHGRADYVAHFRVKNQLGAYQLSTASGHVNFKTCNINVQIDQ